MYANFSGTMASQFGGMGMALGMSTHKVGKGHGVIQTERFIGKNRVKMTVYGALGGSKRLNLTTNHIERGVSSRFVYGISID